MANKVLVTNFFHCWQILSAILFQNERGLKSYRKDKAICTWQGLKELFEIHKDKDKDKILHLDKLGQTFKYYYWGMENTFL